MLCDGEFLPSFVPNDNMEFVPFSWKYFLVLKEKIKIKYETGWQVILSFLKPFELFRPQSVWFTLLFRCHLRLIIFKTCSLVPGHWVLHLIFKSTLAPAISLGIHRLAFPCRESNLHQTTGVDLQEKGQFFPLSLLLLQRDEFSMA